MLFRGGGGTNFLSKTGRINATYGAGTGRAEYAFRPMFIGVREQGRQVGLRVRGAGRWCGMLFFCTIYHYKYVLVRYFGRLCYKVC